MLNHNEPVFICNWFLVCELEDCEHKAPHNRVITDGIDECRIGHCISYPEARCVQMIAEINQNS